MSGIRLVGLVLMTSRNMGGETCEQASRPPYPSRERPRRTGFETGETSETGGEGGRKNQIIPPHWALSIKVGRYPTPDDPRSTRLASHPSRSKLTHIYPIGATNVSKTSIRRQA